jgi:hypothetical protein
VATSITLREIVRHIPKPTSSSFSVREQLGKSKSNLRLSAAPFHFSLLCYNLALLPWPAEYLGTNRDGAIAEVIARIKADPPDVVGLCEVFADDEREHISESLRSLYSFGISGPDLTNPKQDGGLLLLSRLPVLNWHGVVYDSGCAGSDCLSNKGFLHMRLAHPSSPVSLDVFFSHTQDLAAFPAPGEPGPPSDPRDVLYGQLLSLFLATESFADTGSHRFFFGDLNIPGENPTHYGELIRRLGGPADLWVAQGHPPASGFTNTTDNNFYEDPSDAPNASSRLDYILMTPGTGFIPVADSVDILKFTHSGRQISDHFGLRARFELAARVQ